MENHPIPQDITGFQFKLVGNMTIKQFIYLAVGAFFAWIFFFILNLPTLLKWPLSIFSFALGAIIAFVPVDGRPMDVMLRNFLKALVYPSQFVYKKEGVKLSEKISTSQKNPIISKTAAPPPVPIEPSPMIIESPAPAIKPITQEPQFVTQASPAPISPPAPAPAPPPPPQPTSALPIEQKHSSPVMEIQDNSDELEKKDKKLKEANEEITKLRGEEENLKNELDLLKKQLDEAINAKNEALAKPAPPPPPPPDNSEREELEKQLIETKREKEALEKELVSIKAKETPPKKTFSPIVAKQAEPSPRVRSVPSGMEQSVGIPSAPEDPNLITGIVKDSRGNPLQSILIEVKDEDSNPVRAFKTNGLGKFASATSLSNGKYLISFEDPKETHKFDTVEIELVGAPVMPLEIVSVDPREELRRELFN